MASCPLKHDGFLIPNWIKTYLCGTKNGKEMCYRILDCREMGAWVLKVTMTWTVRAWRPKHHEYEVSLSLLQIGSNLYHEVALRSLWYCYCYYYSTSVYFDWLPLNVFQCDWCPCLCCSIFTWFIPLLGAGAHGWVLNTAGHEVGSTWQGLGHLPTVGLVCAPDLYWQRMSLKWY